MNKCNDLYNRLQQDIAPIQIVDTDLTKDEEMAIFSLFILMKKEAIKERDNDKVFTDQFEEIGNNFEKFDLKTKKTLWLYFDLFVKLCEKYTTEHVDNFVLNETHIDSAKLKDVSNVLEDKFGIKMSSGMEEMINIITAEVQKQIKKGNCNMKTIVHNVMEKVMTQFKNRIDSGDININELQQSVEKLMSQMGNPASLFGINTNNKSREEKRRDRRNRLRKKLESRK
jgi:hypothetical protein